MEGTTSLLQGELDTSERSFISVVAYEGHLGRFHYKPSSTWPPLPGDGITVKMPDGSERLFDEQVQMYW